MKNLIDRVSIEKSKAQYTPPHRRNSTVDLRRRRRCVLGLSCVRFALPHETVAAAPSPVCVRLKCNSMWRRD